MRLFTKMLLCGMLASMLAAAASGCESQPVRTTQPQTQTSSALAPPFPDTNWQTTLSGASLRLESDGPCIGLMAPLDSSVTLDKLSAWLKESKPYAGKVPQSTFKGVFMANIGPARLDIQTARKTSVSFQPAWYIISATSGASTFQVRYLSDVLRVEQDGRTGYLTCAPLFNWLKTDKWRAEFRPQ